MIYKEKLHTVKENVESVAEPTSEYNKEFVSKIRDEFEKDNSK